MGLFDSGEEHPTSKIRRYIITGLAFVLLIVGACWYVLRFHKEKNTVRSFFNAVTSGNMQEAYQIWKPTPTYSFKDFLDDWGDNGYYGPVKSYDIEAITDRGSGVVAVIEVSPFQPFPDGHDAAKQSKTKEVRLWVEFKDQSIGFPP